MGVSSLMLLLAKYEGCSLKPYKDTLGKWTIGYGRCLDTRGISGDEAQYLLRNDAALALNHCIETYPWFAGLSEIRQNVVAAMDFQMGDAGIGAFHHMLEALRIGNYQEAAAQMLMSEWASQTPGRAKDMARMMETDSL